MANTLDGAVISNKEAAVRFMFAGNATFTLKSNKSGDHITYKVMRQKKDRNGNKYTGDKPVYFVYLLTGPNNSDDYTYMGMIKDMQTSGFELTAKSRLRGDTRAVMAFQWYIDNLRRGGISTMVELYHVGRCGRCARQLTVPASISTGLGEECASKAGIPYGMKFKAERIL
jgi:hypothetical protein